MKSFLREDPTAAGGGLDDDVIAKLFDGGRVVDHDLSQGDEGVASIQATSGENTPQGSCSPRSLDGDERVDHVHGKGDGGALHDQQGVGGQVDQKIEDGLVSLGPKKAIGTGMNALMIVGGTKSFPREGSN